MKLTGKTSVVRSCAVAAAVLLWPQPYALGGTVDYSDLSIEELMAVEVTSVSKKSQSLSDSATAVFVITNKDLKRSGVTTIPDALRMVPGVNVGAIDSNKWAVTSRGNNGRFADKLLVLIDGREVYTPTFSGVYWEVQDMMLDDVDRIEVIRGPGATIWGANAVNGVINIISKSAEQTQGGLVNLGGGDHEKAFVEGRYGMALSETTHLRMYGKYFDRDEYTFEAGGDAGDDWDMVRSGFRLDSQVTGADLVTVHGDIYSGNISQDFDLSMVTPPYSKVTSDEGDVSGGNVTALWKRTLAPDSSFSVQIYYDSTLRDELIEKEERDSFDIEFQHQFGMGEHNAIIWGMHYHYTSDDFSLSDVSIQLNPDHRQDDLYSAFLQDEITLIPEKLWFTLGSKFEHNDYSGYEVQPSARILWSPQSQHKIWAAVSRAVKTPSRADSDIYILTSVVPPDPPAGSFFPMAITLSGNKDLDAEDLIAYEFGYRFFPVPSLSLDLATYYNDYDNLRSVETGALSFDHLPAYIEIPMAFDNKKSGHTYGAELAAAWQALEQSKLSLAYTYHYSNIDETSPRHQVSLRSETNLPGNVDVDLWLRYVDNITESARHYSVDEYITLDMRLAWRPQDRIELSLVGQNILDSEHLEYVHEGYTPPTEIGRSFYGKVSLSF
jgi:iron complex outermembrane receptor protein